MRTCPTCKSQYGSEMQFCPQDGASLIDPAVSASAAVSLAPPGELAAGTMIKEYRVIEKIGEGGMGSVFSGIHPVIGKKVAIKLLNPALASDAGAVARFAAEARSVNHIQHPNIVDIFAFDKLPDGRHYFVMELLEGRTLKEEIDRHSPLPMSMATQVLWQVCDALEAAHGRGIFHRDLKPDNVFLLDRGPGGVFVKLLDFGIAKLTGDAAGQGMSQTRTGVPMGTPYYMSPEQCRGVGVDHRTDIYSLGVMMYEIFTGQLPFTGNSYIDIIQAHLSIPPRPPTELASVSESVAKVILRAMAKDPAERHQSAAELKRDLEALAQDSGATLVAGTRTVPGPTTTPARIGEPAPTPSFAVPGKTVGPTPKPRASRALVGGIAMVAIAGAALALWGRSKSAPEVGEPKAATSAAQTPPAQAPPLQPPTPTPAPVEPPRPTTAFLHVEVTPEATLKVGEDIRGTGTKFTIEVPPGSHEISLEAPGFEPLREAVAVTAGAELRRTFSLEKSAPRSRRSARQTRARGPKTPSSETPAKTGDATLDPFR